MFNFNKPGKKIVREVALATGLAAATIVGVEKYGGKLVDEIKNLAPVENIETHKGVCKIIKKIHHEADTDGYIAGIPVGGLGGVLVRKGNKPERWSVNLEFNEGFKQFEVPVSEKQFDSLIEGKQYSIVYKTDQLRDMQTKQLKRRGQWVISIEGEQINY